MRTGCVIVAGLMAGLFSGCAVVDGVVDDRADSIDRSAGKSRNEAVLRNIARASENIPLTFVTFSRVSGTTTASGSAAAPSFSLGPHVASTAVSRDVTIANTTLGGSAQASNALDITVLETGDFYKALLDPGDLINFELLNKQGYPRELLFWLFADSVRISIQPETFRKQLRAQRRQPQGLRQFDDMACNGKVPPKNEAPKPGYYEIFNRVKKDESCVHIPGIGDLTFRDMIQLAMGFGLSVEVIQPDETDHKANPPSVVSKVGPRAIYTNVTVYTSSDASKRKPKSQLCRDPYLITQAQPFGRLHQPQPPLMKLVGLLHKAQGLHNCYSAPVSTTRQGRQNAAGSNRQSGPARLQDRLVAGNESFQFEIKTRSTFAIYQFLGQILADNAMDELVMTGLERDTADHTKILSISRDQIMNCAVQISVRNKNYCVPDTKESKNTKLIFSLLTQLIALKTNSKDVGITPTVRVTP